jgi:hypothetical protein
MASLVECSERVSDVLINDNKRVTLSCCDINNTLTSQTLYHSRGSFMMLMRMTQLKEDEEVHELIIRL